MKRNESNCPTGRNLDKLSLKNAGRKSLHALCVKTNKNAGISRYIIVGNLEGLLMHER
jgi:hypothetical protein